MPLSWNEIRQRAILFSQEWSSETSERAEAQSFWNEFFNVFGIRRRTVASFEERVRNLGGAYDFIDLFWSGKLIAEHKSRGARLSRAESQATGYIQSLVAEGREDETPRYVIVSDFARIALHDLEEPDPARATLQFNLADFHNHVRAFAFIAGYETRRLDPEDPANIKAVEKLGHLHDTLEDGGYTGHDLERFLVRILFCLFAEDTGIFEPESFKLFLQNRTRLDGSDLGLQLAHLFQVLNQPQDRRQHNLDEDLAALPYVNGALFAENLAFPEFNSAMRTALLQAAGFQWAKISPAVFGALFQSVMEDRVRRQIGAHYTSERDILKLIRSLFLDELRAEFESIRHDRPALERFHRKLGNLKFLDPACGCGNFLVISYRELRRLEMDVLDARFGSGITEADVRAECRLNVGQMYGIEIEEWPVRIAEVALWLMDHQMNAELFERFGQIKPTTPLTRSPNIRQANALRIDWNEVLPAGECSYVLGNPPFVGAKLQKDQQREDMAAVLGNVRNAGLLDYVSAWYIKASNYIVHTRILVGFVSTNSITQGEQVGTLWSELLRRQMIIHFAHRTFSWESEARGRAHVHVVIVGFGNVACTNKRIYDYEIDPEHPTVTVANNISPYLVEGPSAAIQNRSTPICAAPEMGIGNKPIDDGNYLFSPSEKDEFLAREPEASRFMRMFLGAHDFLHNSPRWCLWLHDANPSELHTLPRVLERIEAVRRFRAASSSTPTQRLGFTPTRFHVENVPEGRYLLIPRHTSERRAYIPMGYLSPDILAGDSCLVIAHATLYHFGILSSAMHMAWVKQVCGRLKSDFRYSNKLVYNNFPWPLQSTESQRQAVEEAAGNVLAARQQFDGQTLAQLYDPLTMPPVLTRAHSALDRAVDRCYRTQPFISDRQRFEYLFALYETLVTPLTAIRRTRRRP